jgi:NUMOD3 motif
MYLYVKTHNVTGLKYLGKTISKDPHKYTGSGTLWLRHLNVHGCDYTTEILLETEDEKELRDAGIYYSELWNVVESKEWANLTIEQGSGGDTSESPAFKEYMKNRDRNGDKNSFYGKSHSEETKAKLAKYASEQWKNKPKSEEHKKKIADSLTGVPFSEERKKKISEAKRGKPAHNKGKPANKFICLHCSREIGGESNFKKWHGENCKENK